MVIKKWKKNIKSVAVKKNWFDQNSYKGMKYSFYLGGFTALSTVFFILPFGPWSIISGLTALLILGLSTVVVKRSQIGEIEYRKWDGYKKYIKNYPFKNKGDDDLIDNISDYLLYGIILNNLVLLGFAQRLKPDSLFTKAKITWIGAPYFSELFLMCLYHK